MGLINKLFKRHKVVLMDAYTIDSLTMDGFEQWLIENQHSKKARESLYVGLSSLFDYNRDAFGGPRTKGYELKGYWTPLKVFCYSSSNYTLDSTEISVLYTSIVYIRSYYTEKRYGIDLDKVMTLFNMSASEWMEYDALIKNRKDMSRYVNFCIDRLIGGCTKRLLNSSSETTHPAITALENYKRDFHTLVEAHPNGPTFPFLAEELSAKMKGQYLLLNNR